jgi:drug/metabolite transporter (DMT)-like permease
MAVLLAFCGALSNALTTIFQRMGVQSAPAGSTLRFSLVMYILRKPIWYLGFATMIAGFGFQAFALGFGGLSLVQPILVSELVFLVLILRIWFRKHLGVREAVGTVCTVAGLAGFLALSDQSGGSVIPSTRDWVIAIICCAVGVGVSVLLTRWGGRVWRSAWFGAGAAVAFALCAAFTKAATVLFAGGFVQLFGHFETYGIALSGLVGMFLAQNAFYSGPITASQATLTIVDPIVSIVLGVTIFGDHIRDTKGELAVEALALAVMILGLIVLCYSPLIVGSTAHEKLTRPKKAAPPVPAAPSQRHRSPTPSA